MIITHIYLCCIIIAGLRYWEPPDNPFVEHARWSPKCPFILSVKGQDFVNLVQDPVRQVYISFQMQQNAAHMKQYNY